MSIRWRWRSKAGWRCVVCLATTPRGATAARKAATTTCARRAAAAWRRGQARPAGAAAGAGTPSSFLALQQEQEEQAEGSNQTAALADVATKPHYTAEECAAALQGYGCAPPPRRTRRSSPSTTSSAAPSTAPVSATLASVLAELCPISHVGRCVVAEGLPNRQLRCTQSRARAAGQDEAVPQDRRLAAKKGVGERTSVRPGKPPPLHVTTVTRKNHNLAVITGLENYGPSAFLIFFWPAVQPVLNPAGGKLSLSSWAGSGVQAGCQKPESLWAVLSRGSTQRRSRRCSSASSAPTAPSASGSPRAAPPRPRSRCPGREERAQLLAEAAGQGLRGGGEEGAGGEDQEEEGQGGHPQVSVE